MEEYVYDILKDLNDEEAIRWLHRHGYGVEYAELTLAEVRDKQKNLNKTDKVINTAPSRKTIWR